MDLPQLRRVELEPMQQETQVDPQPDFDDEDWASEDLECTWCGGERIEDNDDPEWYGYHRDWISCRACAGTGLRKHQTIF